MKKDIYKKLLKTYRSHISRGDYKSAEGILPEIEKVYPAKAWHHRALLYGMLMKGKESKKDIRKKQIEYLKRSLKFKENNPHVWRAISFFHADLGEYDLAEASLKKSLKYCRAELCRADGLRDLGSLQIERGDLKKGFSTLNKALNSKHRPTYLQLADPFIQYYQKTGNQRMVNYWAKKGIMSAKIIEKSGKQAYGPSDAYQKFIKEFESFIRE